MRRLASILVSSALALLVCAAGTPAAHATPRVFEGSLTVSLLIGPGVPAISDTVSVVSTADVTLNSDGIDQFDLPGGVFEFDGVEHPLPDPNSFPLTSIRLDATSGGGSFGGLTTSSGVGFMTVEGAFTIQVLNGIGSDIIFPTYDGDDIGIGLAGVFDFLYANGSSQLRANDWTTGSVTNALGTFSGFSSGNSMRLVSPFEYQLTTPNFQTSPGVAILDLLFLEPVPEPGTAVLLASGMMLLGSRARAARRGGSVKTRC